MEGRRRLGTGRDESNMVVSRDGNTTSELKDLGVWTIRVTCSAKLLKLHKETKKQHQLKSTENRVPLGQGSPHQRLAWAGEASELLLRADSGTA